MGVVDWTLNNSTKCSVDFIINWFIKLYYSKYSCKKIILTNTRKLLNFVSKSFTSCFIYLLFFFFKCSDSEMKLLSISRFFWKSYIVYISRPQK